MKTNYKSDWNAYWQSGLTTSCLSDSKDDYPEAIKTFWIKNLIPLLDDKTQLLDLCSGAGGIPKLLINSLQSTQSQLVCTSTDYTAIEHKNLNLDNSSITYQGNCNCENLPFEESLFDCITSSFGIEYSNLDKTLEQIDRVLKNKGLFAAVFHTENSVIVSNSHQQIMQGNYLIKEIKFFDFFKKIFLSKRSSKTFQKKAEIKFKKLLQEVKLKNILSKNPHVYRKLLESSETIFNYSLSHSISSVVKLITKQEKALIQNQNRMQNLIKIVNDKLIINKIENYFLQKNYNVLTSSPLTNNHYCVGHGLIVRKH